MIEIITGSRLHFGLLRPGSVAGGERRFGGVGMMIEGPGLRIRATPAPSWAASGPLAGRVLAFARQCAEGLSPRAVPALHVEVLDTAPEHVGLGTGTQLGMAVAKAVTLSAGLSGVSVGQLALLAGRGTRSGLGVHGFEQGGLLVDGGRANTEALAPLIARLPVPEDWRVVLALPAGDRGWTGAREQDAFNHLHDAPTDRLCRLVLLAMLPALVEKNVEDFGEALYEFNRLAGEAFVPAQGGNYSSPATDRLIRQTRAVGIRGVGQSSWGPLVFAVTDAGRAEWLAQRLRAECEWVRVTAACNRGVSA
jgi:beta-RFAP synthase